MNKSIYKNGYDGYAIVPNFSNIDHRENVITTQEFMGIPVALPIIPANMKCVISEKNINDIYKKRDIFSIMHRFCNGFNESDNINFVKSFIERAIKFDVSSEKPFNKVVSFSVGVSINWLKSLLPIIFKAIEKDYIPVITIDTANGYNAVVGNSVKAYRKMFGKNIKIIAGNIMSTDACDFLADAGVDAVKVGLSCGASCSTYYKTGVGSMDMFDTIATIANHANVDIIADGGIKNIKDICLALVAGADMVMVGSLFAKCSDSPADVVNVSKHWWNKPIYKKNYYGSASFANKQNNNYIEGFSENYLDIGNSTVDFLKEIKDGIQSMMSYVGCENLCTLNRTQIKIKKYE